MLRPESSAPRTLIADDQPDVLEALHLLLKREGYQIETVNSPKAVLERLHNREYDVLLMDLNYALDTTSGQEGLDLLARVQKLDRTPAGGGDDGLGQHSAGGRSHAARRAPISSRNPGTIRKLLSTLRAQVESRNERRNGAARESGEIEEASATQRGLLPHPIPQFPGYGHFGGLASGRRGERRLSGCAAAGRESPGAVRGRCDRQGRAAALLMSNVQAAVHALAGEMLPTGELCGRINRIVAANVGSGKFITFFYGVLDGARRRFSYTNAGHCEPILVRQNGECVRVNHGGVVLGVFPGLVVSRRARGPGAGRPAGAVHRRHHRDRQRG